MARRTDVETNAIIGFWSQCSWRRSMEGAIKGTIFCGFATEDELITYATRLALD
jgi:hypothetical protein